MRILSLGAGVQSTTMALMAAHGEIEPPDVAIFADTGWEPAHVYEHLNWLRSANVLPFPVEIVSSGNLRANVLARRDTSGGRYAAIPWFTLNFDGSKGIGRRQCTSEYKLTPIMRATRRLLGKGPRERIAAGTVTMLVGISTDEALRMKPARQKYIKTVWPLIDLGMSRRDCLRWMEKKGYPTPPKSSCVGCPFHSNAHWREMRDTRPADWADAIEVDTALRQGHSVGRLRALEFMHSACVPLAEAPIDGDTRQIDMFNNECEGMCGV